MNARDLIEAQHGDEPTPPRPPRPRPQMGREDEMGGMADRGTGPYEPGHGRPGGPMRRPGGMGPVGVQRGDFNPRDLSQMKDFMLLELVRGQGKFYEGIVQKLISGQELEPGQLQHFVDEVHNIEGLPETMHALAQKIEQVIASKRGQPPAA